MTVTSDVRASYARLAAAQKSGAGVPFYMRVVNRRLGRAIAAVGARLGLSPDAMTALSALLAVVGLALLVALPPSPVQAVLVVLVLQTAFAFDSADGQLARLTGGGSRAGEWLDHVVDAGRTLLVHLAVAVAMFRHLDVADGWLLLPLAFAVVASVRFFAQILAEQLTRSAGAAPDTGGRLTALVQTPADVGVVNLVFLLWPWAPAFLAGYGLLALANTVLLLATLRRRHRALRAHGTPA